MKSEEMAKELAEKGVDVEKLIVLYAGTEQVLGESQGMEDDGEVGVLNPKRVLRLQQVVEGGVVISLMIGDLDFVHGKGPVFLRPYMFYNVSHQDEETKAGVYGSYLDYFKRKTLNKAEDAGLVLPKGLSPFRKG